MPYLLAFTRVSWLPVLSSVVPPSLRHKAASDEMLQITEAHPNWPVYADMFEHQSPWPASGRPSWYDTCRYNYWQSDSVDTGHWSTAPLYLTLPSGSLVSISLVSHGLCWTVFRQVKAKAVQSYTNGTLTNHRHVTVISSRLRAISLTHVHWQSMMVDYNYLRSWRWCSQVAGIYCDYSISEMKWNRQILINKIHYTTKMSIKQQCSTEINTCHPLSFGR